MDRKLLMCLAIGSCLIAALHTPAHAQVCPGLPTCTSSGPPDQIGQWGPLALNLPGYHRSGIMLHTEFETPFEVVKSGFILMFGKVDQNGAFLFDPSNPTNPYSEFLPNPPGEPFGHLLDCAGNVALRDGRVFLTGGQPGAEGGTKKTTIFDPRAVDLTNWPNITCNNCWFEAALCPAKRFYPTCTVMGDGRVLTTSGWRSQAGDNLANRPMIYDPVSGHWTELPLAEYCPPPMYECPPDLNYSFEIGWYPFMFLLSNGNVFHAGNNRGLVPEVPPTTRLLNTGLEKWKILPDVDDATWGASAVMYKPDFVLKAGGRNGSQALKTAMWIDAGSSTPAWQFASDMNCGRVDTNLVVLPDGKVLAVGGDACAIDGFFKEIYPAELYDPATETWTLMAEMDSPSWEHSVVLLLPDGRVLTAGGQNPYTAECFDCDCSGGGNPCTDCDYCAQSIPNPVHTWQAFSPPYLFTTGGQPAIRPLISSIVGPIPNEPNAIRYTKRFIINTGQANNITAVNMIKLGANTHGFDQEQRFVSLTFAVVNSNTLWAVAPAHPQLAPPGYYMLFILDDGVPSKARMVRQTK